jgi:opacity protein-like surface antigen
MKNKFANAVSAAVLVFSAAAADPAMAQNRRNHDRNNDAAAAAALGFLGGLIVGSRVRNGHQGGYPGYDNIPPNAIPPECHAEYYYDRNGVRRTEQVCDGPRIQGGQTCVSGNTVYQVGPGQSCTGDDNRFRTFRPGW